MFWILVVATKNTLQCGLRFEPATDITTHDEQRKMLFSEFPIKSEVNDT